MKRKFGRLFLIGIVPVSVLLALLPKILQKLGLHPHYEGKSFDLKGKRALIITTSQRTLGEGGAKTGVYASEMTVPYYEFLGANMMVDLASIKGGEIPIETFSLKYPVATAADKKFLKDDEFLYKAENSLSVEEVDPLDYDLIYMAGGWGAAYDLGISEALGELLTKANAEGIILGSVCHGALGFVKAKDIDGEPLLKGRRVTGVTNKQIEELDVTDTPMHPETELRNLGADYQCATKVLDILRI